MPSRLIQVLFTTSVARAQVEIQALGHNLNTGLIIIHCHCFVSRSQWPGTIREKKWRFKRLRHACARLCISLNESVIVFSVIPEYRQQFELGVASPAQFLANRMRNCNQSSNKLRMNQSTEGGSTTQLDLSHREKLFSSPSLGLIPPNVRHAICSHYAR